MATSLANLSHPASAGGAPDPRRHLFGPITDFLCLGGAFIILVPLFALVDHEAHMEKFRVGMLVISFFLNYPHFAHSYQLFYRDYRAKSFGPDYDAVLRARYVFAGLVVPVLLVAFFLVSLVSGDAVLLGYGANLMAFLVGWHYAKQGYGMLMLDAALKKRFFAKLEKRIFLVNAYALWLFAWMSANTAIHERALWGLQYYTFAVPSTLLDIAAVAALVTSATAIWALARGYIDRRGVMPHIGVVAYLVTLYSWTPFLDRSWSLVVEMNPLWMLYIPALHSLQYMIVTWRYEANYAKETAAVPTDGFDRWLARRFGTPQRAAVARFVLVGFALGAVGFWVAPVLLGMVVMTPEHVFGPHVFMFVFWIFINAHHYFLDNVIWRSENPDTRRYLFGR